MRRTTTGEEFTGHINRTITHEAPWSPSYFSASCDGTPPAIVRQYIEQHKRPLSAGQSSPETHSSPA
ncbi:transposase [Streptomyces sp. NPDC018000]|uniref:transposase n=1 Tax=Streptomyces sp. NPDC018000 TaxID=3365028 RepID=UPI0037896882